MYVCGSAADGYWSRTTDEPHDGDDDIELRLMGDQSTEGVIGADENIALTRIELFIR